MSSKNINQNQSVLVQDKKHRKELKSFLEVIGTLEQWSESCKSSPIPDGLITRVLIWTFFETAIRHGVGSMLPLLITAPFSFAVLNNVIIPYGGDKLTAIDMMFVIFLNVLPPLATVILLSIMCAFIFYFSPPIKSCVSSFVSGLVLGKVIAGVIGFIFYHIIYYFVLKREYIYNYILDLTDYKIISFSSAEKICKFIYSLSDPIIQASWFISGVVLLSITLIYMSFYIGKKRTEKIENFKKEWLLK